MNPIVGRLGVDSVGGVAVEVVVRVIHLVHGHGSEEGSGLDDGDIVHGHVLYLEACDGEVGPGATDLLEPLSVVEADVLRILVGNGHRIGRKGVLLPCYHHVVGDGVLAYAEIPDGDTALATVVDARDYGFTPVTHSALRDVAAIDDGTDTLFRAGLLSPRHLNNYNRLPTSSPYTARLSGATGALKTQNPKTDQNPDGGLG